MRSETDLETHTVDVHGIPRRYLVGGQGQALVFLHGWGLANRTYRMALYELTQRGFRVYAPTIPGFGESPGLSTPNPVLADYADWVIAFLDEAGITTPVTLMGHSFGGALAALTAYRAGDRVDRLVLVNAAGGSEWVDGRGMLVAMSKRPLWDWGLHLQADVWPLRQLTTVLPVVLRDSVPGVLHHPKAFWLAANLARTANVTAELAELGRRGMDITIIWSTDDNVIPEAATRTLSTAHEEIRTVTVAGKHCWLLADPRGFGRVVGEVLPQARRTRSDQPSDPDPGLDAQSSVSA